MSLAHLLVFVNIFVESPSLDDVVQALMQLPNVEEIYEVSGEFDIVTLVSAATVEEFSHFLKTKILKIIGIRSTVTSVVLNAHKGPRGSNGT